MQICPHSALLIVVQHYIEFMNCPNALESVSILSTSADLRYNFNLRPWLEFHCLLFKEELSPAIIDNKNIYAVEKILNEEQHKDGKHLFMK